ncbi:MAG: hypothetical protein K9N46_05415 [Candidatus Marinimicrobia bacterium]|nr:hypothetical protein [Candidatus Neomarinimicrobiota bacterium]MCF7880161.1 hypothetical protein [Candidatus Neomarinimicrobiota bacterium]
MARLRLRMSSKTLTTTASLIANGVTVASNAYLLSRSLVQQQRQRQQNQRLEQLQSAAEVATAGAQVVQTLAGVWRRYHE